MKMAAATLRGRDLRAAALALVLGLTLAGRAAHAHPVDAATLTLVEVQPGRFALQFQVGSPSLRQAIPAPALFPAACRMEGTFLNCGPAGLAGTIQFPWLEGTMTRLMLDIEWLNGARLLRVVTASARALTIYGSTGTSSPRPVVLDYVRLGFEHILTGYDHLLFVVALTLLVRRRRTLLATITAFTVAHSLSLTATVLGLISIPSAPVEATIALSIVLVCGECLRADDSLTRRAPWLVSFAFGLLHGLGFASALMEIGLPAQHIPLALFCFNVGVELGQLTVIAAVLVVRALAQRARFARPWMARGFVYAMGTVAAFWSLDRLAAVFVR